MKDRIPPAVSWQVAETPYKIRGEITVSFLTVWGKQDKMNVSLKQNNGKDVEEE